MVLLLTPAFTNQTDRVEKTRRIGSPEEKPKKSILKDLIFRKIFIKFVFGKKIHVIIVAGSFENLM